jgi:transcriptional regulator with XRE-family HTH domain
MMIAAAAIAAYSEGVITPAQIRAARALLGWKQTDLATASGVSEIAIKNIERGATDPRVSAVNSIQEAFEPRWRHLPRHGRHSRRRPRLAPKAVLGYRSCRLDRPRELRRR